MAEDSFVREKPMVFVDHLIEFMKREHRLIEDEYPEMYQKLGCLIYTHKSTTHWSIEQVFKKLDTMHNDQLKLTSLIAQIEIARDRFVTQDGVASSTTVSG